MNTALVEIRDSTAMALLNDLERTQMIRIIHQLPHVAPPKKKLSKQLAGALRLSNEQYEDFQTYLKNSRSEWDRNI
ncbi:MAG: hypothetical protein LBS63_00800 [Prevotellaceae bacterium]|nr:hypothetical protein [Prevotellaceae bacterium]